LGRFFVCASPLARSRKPLLCPVQLLQRSGDIWFALDENRPLACFADIWTNWTSVRKMKEGETTNDLFAFLTTEPNAEVSAIHPKALKGV
jgi:putative SOS response-associated peptidase YedK